jgi:hypothetical protein
MKKPKNTGDLVSFVDVCIMASEVRAHLLDARNKGFSKKKQHEDWDVNAADRGN